MNELNKLYIKELSDISLSFFRKNFFGIQNGSISLRNGKESFIINKKNVLFDKIDNSSLIELRFKKDYRWNEADEDAGIHLQIYQSIEEAKYICFVMPPYTTALSLKEDILKPKDFFGSMNFNSIDIYKPQDFNSWQQRSKYEISSKLKKTKENFLIIKGVGVYIYDRDIYKMAQTISIIENSCRILLISK